VGDGGCSVLLNPDADAVVGDGVALTAVRPADGGPAVGLDAVQDVIGEGVAADGGRTSKVDQDTGSIMLDREASNLHTGGK
jgi:hypothetical protein